MNPVQPIVQRVLLATGFGFIVFFSFVLLSAFLVRNDTQFQRLLYQQDFTYLYQIGMIATVCAFAAYCGGASRIKVLIKNIHGIKNILKIINNFKILIYFKSILKNLILETK